MLVDLRDRLRTQGELPPLPEGWGAELAVLSAYGDSFSGDFLVTSKTGPVLELVLVDVSGKGIAAGTRSLLLSGALITAAEAERWADAVDRWQQDASPPFDAYTEAMAATLRAILCRRGVQQMRADADEAARKFAVVNFRPAVTPLLQGMARVLGGDLDDGDAFFSDALSLEEERGAPDITAVTLCERSLAAMARGVGPTSPISCTALSNSSICRNSATTAATRGSLSASCSSGPAA